MKKFTKLAALILALLFTVTIVACNKENSLSKVIKSGVITIATSPDYAPFEFINPNETGDNQYVGADIELMKYIAKELGVTLKIQKADFDSTLTLLTTKSVDMGISGYTYKADREETMDYTSMYYDEGAQIVLVPADSPYTTLKEVAGETLAGQASSLQYDYITDYIYDVYPEESEGKSPRFFVSVGDGINLLKSGQVYGLVLAAPVAAGVIEATKVTEHGADVYKYKILEEAIPVAPEDCQVFALLPKNKDTSLLDKINEIIDKVVTNNLYQGWFKEAQELNASLISETA